MLHSHVLQLKLTALKHLDEIHAYLAFGGWQQLEAAGVEWLSYYYEFDTLVYQLQKLRLQHVCDPSATQCWVNSVAVPFTMLGPGQASAGLGSRICMRCLRSWTLPEWYGDRADFVQAQMWEVPIDPFISKLRSLTRHRAVTDIVPLPAVEQINALNWYGALFPEFFQELWWKYPSAFPEHLHGQVRAWLDECLYHVKSTAGKPVFMHPMFRGFIDGFNYSFNPHYPRDSLQSLMPAGYYKPLGQF